MSAQKLTKKQKKALAFRDRKGKGKAKSFDDLDHVPVDENQDLAEVEMGAEAGAVEAPAGRGADAKAGGAQDADALGEGHKGKKRKREEKSADDGVEDGAGEKKSKKKRKGVDGEGVAAGDATDDGAKKDDKKVKQRYILFVGNLKYTTSKEAIEKHFSKCDPPPTVRLITPKPSANSKPTNKSKGCAFVEFSHRNALQQGLKLHQTELDGRKINVELTAGGGGKSEHRLEKVKKRNRELHEQRKQLASKQQPGKKKASGEGGGEEVQLERPQRYSATSGVEQAPLKQRTWSIPEGDEDPSARKRGSKKGKKRPPKDFGTGVNAIPVG